MKNLLAAALVVIAGNGTWLCIPGGAWTPSPVEVQALQESVRLEFEHHARSASAAGNVGIRPWAAYSFQYQGIVLDGKKTILVRAFCQAPADLDTSTRWLLVQDGGACYFGAFFDPATERTFNFSFHGEA